MLKREEKEKVVASIKTDISKAQAIFLTNVVGITANDAVQIRKNVRDAKGKVIVTRNTLIERAAKGTDSEKVLSNLKGPSAVVLAFGDAVAVAKAILDASKANELVTLRSGMLNGKLLSSADLKALASLPSRDQMLGTLLATFNAPVSAFARVIEAIREKKAV